MDSQFQSLINDNGTKVSLQQVVSRMQECDYFEISTIPDYPGTDETIKRSLVSYQIIPAFHGDTLILGIQDNNKNRDTLVIPDILLTIINDLSNEWQEKYYFYCLSRSEYYAEQNDIKYTQEKRPKREYRSYMKYRLILALKK
ncbi:MAG: hypothetical protein OWR52_04440 [Acidibacillus sp.]|nr:hypothetical protein [Acidibacillus sp.]